MKPYNPILATLGFVMSADGKRTLLVHRIHRGDDEHLGKFNGLGGKMQPDEDIVSCMKREIAEEAGIKCTQMLLRGTINWTSFGKNGENWFGFIFRIDQYSGTPYTENKEGPLAWHAVDSLDQLPMWLGDRHFLPLVFDEHPGIFHGYMPYKDGEPVSWSYQRI
ncbi:MAG: 8-oxo-dGTP diphosphatase [Desulfobulbaceae bacterium]|uniref:8-oxo-dGTP diphosphatase n=1 Tax=Candidatus Desulfobia pelagia TaxID=2841692 RepID=A0A8J6NDE7_9BACT|nr:8-oxo-dGTP diphosphatase [Candidatus Desulfobia pelagia]